MSTDARHTALVDELLIRQQDNKLKAFQVRRIAAKYTEEDLLARLAVVEGTCHLKVKKLRKALQTFHKASGLAVSRLARTEARCFRVAIAIGHCDLGLANEEANSALWFAQGCSESRAVAAFSLARVHAYKGQLDEACRHWEFSESLTSREIYRVDARHNLAKAAALRGETGQALLMLEEATPLSQKQAGFFHSIWALVYVQQEKWEQAVKSQSEAARIFSHRSALEKLEHSLILAEYQAGAGNLLEARKVILAQRATLFELRENVELERAAAALLAELLRIKEVTAAAINACRLSLADLPNRRSGRSDRRDRRQW